jgi:hypothetical protein
VVIESVGVKEAGCFVRNAEENLKNNGNNMENMENFLENLMPHYANLATYEMSPYAPFRKYLNQHIQFRISESRVKVIKKIDHLLKGVVIDYNGEYLDDEEIDDKFELLIKNLKISESLKSYMGDNIGKYYDIYFDVYVKLRPKGNQGTAGCGDLKAMYSGTSGGHCIRLW